jgi:hypothetical protein
MVGLFILMVIKIFSRTTSVIVGTMSGIFGARIQKNFMLKIFYYVLVKFRLNVVQTHQDF